MKRIMNVTNRQWYGYVSFHRLSTRIRPSNHSSCKTAIPGMDARKGIPSQDGDWIPLAEATEYLYGMM
ncbi:MAG: hypothetical protein PHP50_11600 [Lachnospiraceae bacterium]|nr:hypothetical protein [Lachnospiraceae bacterium]